ncbi:hypothetical protein K466DRAFT_66203 [Polyporus arcularius HHB13444]|uniref:Uncharacterized protein n=1 Tax=Polyporus arcularius HHB13444 TaxID=1314778 RepID=A0A5C3PFT7_9APHY|nr:hypothetical protein K466DRAFT_66203 [Polyporus arcularius HHB13444]
MLNNLSLSSPLADLEDVGPSWGHSAEAPFYNPKPKPKLPVQSPAQVDSHSMPVPPASPEIQAQTSMNGPPESSNAAGSGKPASKLPLSAPLPDSTDDGSIDFTPFFAENTYLTSMPATHPVLSPSPFTMYPVAPDEWVAHLGYNTSFSEGL